MIDDLLESYFSTEARLFANPNLRGLALYKALGKEVLRNEVVTVAEGEAVLMPHDCPASEGKDCPAGCRGCEEDLEMQRQEQDAQREIADDWFHYRGRS